MIVIGFFKGHNATACLLRDGNIIAAVSEERFNRIKNVDVFPIESIKYCVKQAGIGVQDVDLFVRTYTHPEGSVTIGGETKLPFFVHLLTVPMSLVRKLVFLFPQTRKIAERFYNVFYGQILTPYYQKQFRATMSKYLGIDSQKIIFADHHICHAYAAYYGFVSDRDRKKDQLVITLDGAGDGDCGGVWTVKKGKWKRISRTPLGNSLALFYGSITQYLGMKINEHEYKVMGLAPYVSKYETEKVYPLFKDLYSVDDNLIMRAQIMSGSLMEYFDRALKRKRFDGIAAAAQLLIEQVSLRFIEKAISKTKIENVVLAGGLFMNVKANKYISESKLVKNLTVCPSAADESTVFGAAYHGYQLLCRINRSVFNPQPISDLYLGPEFSDEEIGDILKSFKTRYEIKRVKDIEEDIARLLANGNIVARFKGRMEWGARALGNRSILMDPRRRDLVQILNSQIKSRDFWMPFAASVLREDAKRYLKNISKSDPRFMIMAYDTTDIGRLALDAGTHPSDLTCRPQIIDQDANPEYFKLISNFKKLTGVGAVLNTSFNYHGEPVVCSPSDALNTFSKTGLRYLAIGSYLVCKR